MKQWIIIFASTMSLLHAGFKEDAILLLAQHSYQEHHYKDALEYYDDLSIYNEKTLYNRANVLYQMGRYRKALAQYMQIEKPSLLQQKFHNIGNCFVALGEYKKAIIFYRNALKFEENNATKSNLTLAIKRYKKEKEKVAKEAKKQSKENIAFRKGVKKINRFKSRNGNSDVKDAPDPKQIQKLHNSSDAPIKRSSGLIEPAIKNTIRAIIISDKDHNSTRYQENRWNVILNRNKLKTLLIPLKTNGENHDKTSY